MIWGNARRVLLVRHSYGAENWELPGGAAERDESVLETAIREVREETGLDVVPSCLGGVYYVRSHNQHHFLFICRLAAADQTPRPTSPEITDCGFWPVHNLPRPISDFTIRRIQDALSPRTGLLPTDIASITYLT